MTEILEILISWPVTIWLVFTVLGRDERQLTEEQRRRAWPPASRLAAGVYFGILCLPVHFWRTRRSLLGTLEGLAWGVAIALVDEAIEWCVELSAPLWAHRLLPQSFS